MLKGSAFLVITFFLTTGIFFTLHNSAYSQSAPTATIRVCQVIANPDGSIVTGAEQPGRQFRFRWFDPDPATMAAGYNPASSIPPDALFTTPLTLNTRLPNIPEGPGPNGYNAQCKDDYAPIALNYNDRGTTAYGNLFYRSVAAPTGDWQPITYHDGYSGTQSLFTLGEYDGNLFDGDPNNDGNDQRRLNSDGHLELRPNTNRTVLLYTRYSIFFNPNTNCENTNSCVTFTAGRKTGFNTIIDSGDITVNDPNVWVKITVTGRNETPQTIRINENINTTNFVFDNPSNSSNLQIFQNGSNITATCTSCITSASSANVALNLPAIPINQHYDIFIKILPQIEGVNLPVNSSSSTIRYNDGTVVPIPNDTLTVGAAVVNPAYFTTQSGGDIYSGGNIINPLPAGTALFETVAGILLRRPTTPIQLGSGTIANPPQPTYHLSGYTHANTSITKLINDLQKDATIATQPYNAASMANGVYRYTSSQEFNFTYDATTRPGNQQYILLVDGDLIIGGNIKLPVGGREGIVFVATGNIYIKPNVEELHGIFITQGTFYTGCNGGACSTTDPNSLKNNLIVQGSVMSTGGISLNRLGTDTNQKAETFIYRPDLMLFASSIAGYSDFLWQEVEP